MVIFITPVDYRTRLSYNLNDIRPNDLKNLD